jgi:hypothetical protein
MAQDLTEQRDKTYYGAPSLANVFASAKVPIFANI